MSEATMESVGRVLGAASPDAERSNYEILNWIMTSLSVSGTTGGRTSEGTYCGLSSVAKTAESDAHLRGAWIAISPSYISLIERVAAVAVAFQQVLREVSTVERFDGGDLALDMLGNVRSSAFHYWDVLWHEADPEFDAPDIWERFIGSAECLAIARAAVTFTICHELAHLTQGDSSAYRQASA